MREALESLGAAICVKDREGRFLYINSEDARLYNASPEDLIGKTVESWVGRETFLGWLKEDNAIMDQGRATYRAPHLRSDVCGREYWLYTSKIPLRNSQGECDRLLVIHHDVTPLKRMELENHRLQQEIQSVQKMEAMGSIATGIAHEFNNLMTPMLLQIEAIQSLFGAEPRLKEILTPMRQAIEQGREICQKVLAFRKDPNGEREALFLNEVTRGALEFIGKTYDRRISFEWDLDASLVMVCTSRSAVSQVLTNLGNNARDALTEKLKIQSEGWRPKIRVVTQRLERKNPHQLGAPQLPYQRISLTDNGVGMPLEVRQKLFQPFFTTKGHGQGNGVGLYVSWSLIQSLNGWIEVESEPGQWTTFHLYLPEESIETNVSTKKEVALEEAKPTRCNRILLVEDNALVSQAVSQLLQAKGHQVEIIEDGLIAAERVLGTPGLWDLIITDLNLPGLSGKDLIRQVRQVGFLGKILALSGHFTPEDERELLSLGADACLMKPPSPKELLKWAGQHEVNTPRVIPASIQK